MLAPVTHEREPRQPLFVSPYRKPMDGAQDGTAGLTDDDGDSCRSLAGDPARWVLVRERLWFRGTRRAIRALPETDRPEPPDMAGSLPPDEREGGFG